MNKLFIRQESWSLEEVYLWPFGMLFGFARSQNYWLQFLKILARTSRGYEFDRHQPLHT